MNPEQMSREELVKELKDLLEKEKEKEKEKERAALLHDLHVHQIELELQNRNLRDAQSALEESRARFEDLYDFAPIAYYTFDSQGCVQEANLTGATMVGRDRAQIIGVPFLALVEMEDPEIFRRHLRRCAEDGKPVVTEMHLSTRRGEARDVQAISAPVLDQTGRPVAFRTSFTDISRLKQTEAELKRARDQESLLRGRFELLDRISASLAGRLARGNVATPPPEFFQEVVDEARLACDAEYAALGIGTNPARPFERWVFSGMEPSQAAVIGRHPSPGGLLGEVIRTRRSIRLRDLREHPRFRGFPAHHPEMRSFMGVVVPDGERVIGHLYLTNKRTADEFNEGDQKTMELLAQRAGTAIEIARLASDVLAAVAARDNLLAIVSHDLRGPLHAIQLSADVLAEMSPAEDRRQGRKQIEVIRRAGQRMNRFLEDLLDAAQIESGAFAIEPARQEVAPLIEQSLELIGPVAAGANVRLEQEVPPGLPPIRGDRGRLTQVFSNLVGNAIKFSPAGGVVRVRAVAEHTQVQFSVSDDGPGIAKDQRTHLFDRYWKGKGARRRGIGLGLYIAKGIVEAHNGRIWVESQVGAGTTFHFAIPVEHHGAREDHLVD